MKAGQAGAPAGESEIGGGPGVSEELLLKARADEAEERCEAHESRIAELESELRAAREAIDASERRREIDRTLGDADTVDLETARLLTEAAVAQMDEPDVAMAVEELRRRKGFLFHVEEPAPTSRGVAMRPAPEAPTEREELDGLAERARQTGDRRLLLRYLRQRRC